jgi:drug/metabolite transporter (DMT)-like permease
MMKSSAAPLANGRRTPLWAGLLVALCALVTATAQIFYKLGAARLPELVTNVPLLIGLALYGLSLFPFLAALRVGSVNVLYPVLATSYIWTSLLSSLIFHEDINAVRWLGMAIIFAGMVFIGHGSRRDT